MQTKPKSADKNNLIRDVEFLTKLKPARNYYNIDSLNKAADYIKSEFKAVNNNVEEQKFIVDDYEYKNIICSFGPTDAERIIVGAHYDVAGEYPGADDNASGVAGLLELARLLKAENKNLKNRIDLVAFTLEEPPVFGTDQMGSAIHAKSLYDSRAKIRAMISVEMIGYYSDKKDSQKFPIEALKYIYPSTGNFISVVSNLKGTKIVKEIKNYILKGSDIDAQALNAPASMPGVDLSDHRNYWKYNYDAVMITDTSFYRNDNYHKQSDKIETLNFDKMAEVVKGVYWAVINL